MPEKAVGVIIRRRRPNDSFGSERHDMIYHNARATGRHAFVD